MAFVYKNRTALITGASSGIGKAFAEALAERGMNVVLVARNEDALLRIAQDISVRLPVQTYVMAADLSKEDSHTTIQNQIREWGLDIDLLINNAGFMTHGPFELSAGDQNHAEVMVNIAAVVNLTHAFLPAMLSRRQGGVINVASVAGFQPIPYLSLYAATKAFVISFSVALSEECRDRNVAVLGLCPGTTSTELFTRADAPEAALGQPRRPEQVVATALKGLESRRSLITDGLKNTLLTHGPRLIPRWFAARCAGKTVKPKPRS
jgi:short-subunit dehydrogenase